MRKVEGRLRLLVIGAVSAVVGTLGACGGTDGVTVPKGADEVGDAGEGDATTSDAGEADAAADAQRRDGAVQPDAGDASPTDGAASDTGVDAPEGGDASGVDAGPPVVAIQDIQDGTVTKGSVVRITKKFVTGARVTTTANLYVQEPDGQTTVGHTYPEYAGMNVFLSAAEVSAFPGVSTLSVGDCISVTGTTSEFPAAVTDVGTTQLATITAIGFATGCGSQPTPHVVTLADVATDTDDVAAGNQPGGKAEIYEGVLLMVKGVKNPLAANGNRFSVTPGTSSLEIDSFLVGSAFNYAANTSFSSITGVYSQNNRETGLSLVVYRLKPRILAELAE